MNLIYNLIKIYNIFFPSFQTLALVMYFGHFNWLWKPKKGTWKLEHQLAGREKLVRGNKVPMDNEKKWQNTVYVFI